MSFESKAGAVKGVTGCETNVFIQTAWKTFKSMPPCLMSHEDGLE